MKNELQNAGLNQKVLLIGWDAAEWKVINPLMDAGKMPHLQKLVEGGVMGNMATLQPAFSPMLWTSIATGKRPYKHGIYGFTEPAPDGKSIRPITNLSRRCVALWNILQLQGKKSNVVGWWPSHPAEPISGIMVSDMFQKHVGRLDSASDPDQPTPHLQGAEVLEAMHQRWPIRPGTIHPPQLTKKLRDLRIHPQELTEEHILPFVPNLAKVDQSKDHRIEIIAKILCECSSIHAVATGLMQNEPWDLMAVYSDAIDHFSHGFMNFHPPKLPWVKEDDFEIYQTVIEAAYRYHDMMLGTLMLLAGQDTLIMLISDHGFHPDHNRKAVRSNEPAAPAEDHSQYGIIVMNGPGIKKDERIYGANLLDVTPTLLYAMGLPVGEDMDGKVLMNAFENPQSIRTIPSWDEVPGESGMHPPDSMMDPMESKEALDQLVALGYIEKPDDNAEIAVRQTVRELEYNLARSYMDSGLYLQASSLLEKLLNEFPDEYRFGTYLIRCYHGLDQLGKVEPLIEELRTRKMGNAEKAKKELEAFKEKHVDQNGNFSAEVLDEKLQRQLRSLHSEASINPAAFDILLGNLKQAQKDYPAARDAYARALKRGQEEALVPLGLTLFELDQLEQAESCFKKALEKNPNNATAHLAMAKLHLKNKNGEDAIDEALNAVGLLYHQPEAHFILAQGLHMMGDALRAVEALRVATSQNPNLVKAWKLLARIHEKALQLPEQAKIYRDQEEAARTRLEGIRSGTIKPEHRSGSKKEDRALSSDMNLLEMSEEELGKIRKPLEETLVVVTGLPRSGTSMMMQMLEAGGLTALSDGLRSADEDNPKGYYEYAPATRLQRDASWIPKASGKVVKIVAQLLRYLPTGPSLHYRVVFMTRDLTEVLASQYKMLERDQTWADDPRKVRDSLKDTFSKQIHQVFRMLNIRKIPSLSVDYHRCINDPLAVANELNEFFDQSLNVNAMVAVVDRKLYRNRAEEVGGPSIKQN